mmetsp:Transcript_28883/g.51483  ORF Transcript_28883/g.51483 Transcript_28883/m.51483 type:complete len:799 (+) Transcript_28883:74-2470(+)
MEDADRRSERLNTFRANMIRKSQNLTEDDLADGVDEIVQNFISLFKLFRSHEQKDFEEINTMDGSSRNLVSRKQVDLMLRNAGVPEVMLITVINSVLPSTFTYEFFNFYHRVVGITNNYITKKDLEMIIEVLGMPDRLGKETMLILLGHYGINAAALMSFLQEGDAARRVLNPETSAKLFNIFKASSDDKQEKVEHCDFQKLLPLMIALFVESEICTVLRHRIVYLDIMGVPDKHNTEHKSFLFNDILPFTEPVPKPIENKIFTNEYGLTTEHHEDEEKIPLGPLESEYAQVGGQEKSDLFDGMSQTPSIIKIAIRVLKGFSGINDRVLTYRNIITILNEFRISGFSDLLTHDNIFTICSIFKRPELMDVDEQSRLERMKLSVQMAIPFLSELICSLKARRTLTEAGFPKNSLKFEQVRWEIAAYALRLTKEGIKRYLVEELGWTSNLDKESSSNGLMRLFKHAMPSIEVAISSSLAEKVTLKLQEDPTLYSLTDCIFDTLFEHSLDAFKTVVANILSPKTMTKLGGERLIGEIKNGNTVVSVIQEYNEHDDFFRDLFEENYKWKRLGSFLDKYTIDTDATVSIKEKLKAAKKNTKENPTQEEFKHKEDLAEEMEMKAKEEKKRLEMLQLAANRIVSASQVRMEKRAIKKKQSESSAFPNSKLIPVSALRNILEQAEHKDIKNSRYLKLLGEKLETHGDQMDFFEFSKTAAVTQIEMSNRKGRNKKLNRLKEIVELTGKQRARSESPKRDTDIRLTSNTGLERLDKVKTNKFKPRVTVPEKKSDPASYNRACACCALF